MPRSIRKSPKSQPLSGLVLVVLNEYRLPKSARPRPQANGKSIRDGSFLRRRTRGRSGAGRADTCQTLERSCARANKTRHSPGLGSAHHRRLHFRGMGFLWFVILAGGAIAIGLGALAIVIAAACTTTYRRGTL
jgi:hypothetical protein